MEEESLDPDAAKELCGIAVTNIVHGGKYWVSEPPGINMSKEREALVILEAHLSEKMCRTYEITTDIPANKLIAVKNEATGCWHRGKLLSPMPDSSTSRSRVFLVDHGEFLMDVKINHLQPLPEEMQELPHQAFVVCLYGLIPLTVDVHLEDINDKFHLERNAIWTTASEIFAQNMLKSSTSAHLIGIRVEGKTIHGEIFLNVHGNDLISLNKEMCRNKYAFYSEEDYEKVIEHERNVERRIRLNEEALIEAERLEQDKANLSNFSVKTLKHVLMEDFMKEYASKKLIRQEITARALHEMRQDVNMRGLQATDQKTREELEAKLLSSAPRSLGRASVLRSWKEKESKPSKGRGLTSSLAVGEGDDSSSTKTPGSNSKKRSSLSPLSLLDSLSSVQNASVFQNEGCGDGSPTSMIPAGYPLMLNEPAQGKKRRGRGMLDIPSVVNSGSALKSDEDSTKNNFSHSSINPQRGNDRVEANVERSGAKAIGSPQSNFLVGSGESAPSATSQVSTDSKMSHDFVQMCKLYAHQSLSQPGESEQVGMCERNGPGPSVTLNEMKTVPEEIASPKGQRFVAKGVVRVDSSESKIKNINMSKAKGATDRENVGSSSEPGVHASEAKNCHAVGLTNNDIQRIIDMKQKNGEHNAGISDNTIPNRLMVSGPENTPAKSRKEKSVNPLFSLLDMVKKKRKVNTSCDTDKSVTSAFDQQDGATGEENKSSKIETLCDKPQPERSQIESDVEVSCLSDDIEKNPCSANKTLNVAPLLHQECSISSPTPAIESEKPKESVSNSKVTYSMSVFAAGEWKNANWGLKGSDRTQPLTRLSPLKMEEKSMEQPALSAECKYWKRQGRSKMDSSDICSDSSVKPKDVPAEVILSENEEHKSDSVICIVKSKDVHTEVVLSENKEHKTDSDICLVKRKDVPTEVVLSENEEHKPVCTSATTTPKLANNEEHSSCKQSSKPGFSGSIERFFKLFHSRKQVQESQIESGMANLPAEDKQRSGTGKLDGKETRPSDDIILDPSEDDSSHLNEKTSEANVCSVSEVAEDLDAKTPSSNFVHNSSCEEDKRKPVELSALNVSSVQGEFSGSVVNDNLVGWSDDCVSREIREVHSLAESLSKIEAEKNAKIFNAIKSMKDLSVRLPLYAAQESISKRKNNCFPQTPVANNDISIPQVSAPADKTKEVEKQKTLEPEAVRPSSVLQPAVPLLLSASWMSNLVGGDCFLTAHRIKMSRVLVRGHLLAQPIQSIAQAPFKGTLHEALSKMGYRDPMRIQTYTWPALMRGHNLIMVNPPRSGKTLGYLLPLISFMLSPDLYTELPDGNGPLGLILCPSWNVVAQVNDYCQWLLQNVHIPTRIIPVYGGLEDEQTIPLINGCDILITTPRCFLRIFSRSRIITNFDRLCHLVFDEADTLMKKFLPEVKEILKECQVTLKKRARMAAESNPSGDSDSYQVVKFVAAAKTWCPQMESFVKNIIEKPLLCIGSYLEAAVFAQLKPTLHVVGFQECLKRDELTPLKPDDRVTEVDNVVLGILKKSLGFERFVVTCDSAEVVLRLAPKVIELGANLLVVHECQHHVDIAEIRQTWLCSQISGALPVLLISDETLSEFNIGDAEHLIHVGVPASSKTKFGLRFSTLMDNYRDIFAKENTKKNCSVDIVVDITEPEVEISGLNEFLQRLGMSIPPELEAVASKSLLCKEMLRKKDLLLCPSIKSFGECDASDCKYRHTVLPSVDQPSEGIPTCGEVRVKVLHVINASQLTVRLLEHIKPDGTKVSIPSDYFHIAAGLARHFRNPNNMMLHSTPRVGDMCVIESGHNLYQRAQVVAIVDSSLDKLNPLAVSINLIDEGTTKIVKAFKLLHLPDQYKEYPPQAKELIICRMMPRDLDTSWSKAASVKVAELLEEAANRELDGREIVGVVVLALGNTLWVDPLECREWLEKQKTTIIHMAIRRDLLRSGLAVDNPGHVQKLRKLCDVAALSMPEKEIMPGSPQSIPNESRSTPELPDAAAKPKDQPTEISWESLNCDDLIEVNVIAVESPSSFRVQKVSNTDVLSLLSDEIQRWVSAVQQTSCSENSGVQKDYDIGSICIGFCKGDNSWCRAKVLGLVKSHGIALVDRNSETSDEKRDAYQEGVIHYELFFVDFGDAAAVSISEMIPIPESLMKIPFQSIECSLLGVKPIRKESEGSIDVAFDDAWDEDANDAFYALCRDKDDVDIYRPILAKAFGTDGSGAHGGLKYLVVLYDKNDQGVKRIGESLVEEGFAKACQVKVDGEPEDDMLMELESHWIGEGALLPFTPALTDAIDQPIAQLEEPSPTSDEASKCTALVPVQGGSITNEVESEQRTNDADENDDSDSFEIVMTDEEAKMYEEKLRSFLGISPRPKDTQATGLKSIAFNEASLDDHSSLASYEVISESSSQSVGRFEELTMDDAVGLEKSEFSSPDVSGMLKGSDSHKILPSSVNVQELCSLNTIVECPGSEESSLEEVSKENEKCPGRDVNTNEESFKVEINHGGIDGSVESKDQNSEEIMTLKSASCGDEKNETSSTSLHSSDNASVVKEQSSEEFIDRGLASGVSSEIKSVDVSFKCEDERHYPCVRLEDSEVYKETDILVNVSLKKSDENGGELEVGGINESGKKVPSVVIGGVIENQDSSVNMADPSPLCCGNSEESGKDSSVLGEHDASKECALSIPVEEEYDPVLDSNPVVETEICDRQNSEGKSQESNSDMNLESEAIGPVPFHERNDNQALLKFVPYVDFSKSESFKSGEIVKVDFVCNEDALGNQVSQELTNSDVNLASEVIAGALNESNSGQTPSKSMFDVEFSKEESLRVDELKNVDCVNEEAALRNQAAQVISDSNVNPAPEAIGAGALNESDDFKVILKSAPDGDFSKGESLEPDEMINVDCASEEADLGNQDSEMSENDVNNGSEVIGAVASNERVINQSLFKSSSESCLPKDDSLNLLSESCDINRPHTSLDGNLFSGDTNNVNIKLGSVANDQSSKECTDVTEPSVKPLLGRDLHQGATEAAIKEIKTEVDVPVEGFYSDHGESLESCRETKASVSLPPLIPAKIPQVKWIQNKWEIILTVELPGMKQYSVFWKSNKLLYIHASSGRTEESCFALELPLWACINTEDCVHMPTSNSTLKVILPKGFTSMEWPRLLSSPNRPLWLSIDFDRLDVDGDEDSDERSNELINYKSSDDGTDSEDEGPETGIRSEEVNYDPYDPFS